MSPVKNKDKFSVGKKLNSFTYALSGLRTFVQEEHNFWLYVTGVFCSVGLGFFFDINRYEWMIQSVITALICSAELMNTAVENVVDLLSPEYHSLAGKAKDVASAAVLLAVLGGLAVFLMIYGPRGSVYIGQFYSILVCKIIV